MRQDKKTILVTKSLTGTQIQYARILGLEPVVAEALQFKFPEYWDEVLKVITDHPKGDWVFTSRNGVRALERMMRNGLQVRPNTRVYAVGSKTQEALKQLGVEATTPVIEDSKHLAGLIVEEGRSDSIIYFHGNLSRDELETELEDAGIEVVSREVYRTMIDQVMLPDRPVEAILFYSPSGVEAFKRGEGFDTTLPLLCAIGPTTAEALRDQTDQLVVEADEPSTEALLRLASREIFDKASESN